MSLLTPYLTFVVAARNDDYGGHFLHRLQVFVDALLSLWEKHDLDGELIIVEWNPPKDQLHLKDALQWPKSLKRGAVRILEVPNAIHQRLANSDKMPIFEYIAKNVGIRRAQGEYVLATNPDLLYSDRLISYLASNRLRANRFYRIDRYDVNDVVPVESRVEQQLEFCESHTFRATTRDGMTSSTREGPKPTASERIATAPRALFRSVRAAIRKDGSGLYTNAAGDFFLMARHHWHRLRGYPELQSHSFIDGYICFMAASSGLRQVILESPYRIYHQEHDRSEHGKRPLTDYKLFLERSIRMLRARRPEILNDAHWGLGNDTLGEFKVSR